jgi:formylglycine-generating enzyme required for sulfatase activity
MVWAGSFCIDRYEASRTDASADAAGVDESQACSRPNVMPWVVDTMTDEVFATYQAACSAAGKRLCTAEEWLGACQGPASTVYVFGDTWDAEKCNCVDSFCDDYCAANGIVSCNTSQNCGYQYSCYHPVPSGQFPDCSNAYGHFDMGGNVWEIVSSTSSSTGYEIRGGAFNCGQPSQRLQCSFVANWTHLFAGFRCCL